MAIAVINRKFTDYQNRELTFPFWSGADLIRADYTIQVNFTITFSFSNSVIKDGDTLLLANGNWEDFGFFTGADISGTFGANNIPTGATVLFIDGGLMSIDATLTGLDDEYTTGTMSCDSAPDAIEINFNLIPNNLVNGATSLIDGENNRFTANIGVLAVSDTVDLTQLGLRSGGAFYDARITKISTDTYIVRLKFRNWLYKFPNLFTNTNCVKPWIEFSIFPQYNNPTVKLSHVNTPSDANTGLFNEIGNSGIQDYQLISFAFDNYQYFDPTQVNPFTAVISGDFNVSSLFNIACFFDDNLDSDYKNLATNIDENLCLAVSEFPIPLMETTVIAGFINNSGAKLDFTNLFFQIVGSDVQVTGNLSANSEFQSFIESKELDNRNLKIAIRCEDSTLEENFINPSWILCYDSIIDKQPIELGEYPMTLNEVFGHDQIRRNRFVIEDDIKFKFQFKVPRGTKFNKISCELGAVNTDTLDNFRLGNEFFQADLVPFPILTDGSCPYDVEVVRPFFLTSTNPNNIFKVSRYEPLDDVDEYGVMVEYSALIDWKYWITQLGANVAFYGNNNQDWFNYLITDWIIGLQIRLQNDLGEYKNFKAVNFIDYDFVTANFEFFRSNGDQISTILSNEIVEVRCTHTFVNEINISAYKFGQTTVEPFEQSPRYDLSSIHLKGTNLQNPLSSIDNSDLCTIELLDTYTVRTRALFDPSKVTNLDRVSFTSRVLVSSKGIETTESNRHKATFKAVQLPNRLNFDDRGKIVCCCEYNVLASLTSNDTYKNDISSRWQIGDNVVFSLLKGAELANYQPSTQEFPNDETAKYCTIKWKDVLIADGSGKFTLNVAYEIAGIAIEETLSMFNLDSWDDNLAWTTQVNGTVRLMSVFNDANANEGINFTNANIVDTIRFEGDFNDFQPNTVIDNLQYRNNSMNKIKRENLTRWTLSVYPTDYCILDRLVNLFLLAENNTFVSDYNQFVYDRTILDKQFILSEAGGGAKIENFGGSNLKSLTCEFEPKIQKSKTHFGNLGQNGTPNPTIPLIPNVVNGSGGDATYTIINSESTEITNGTIECGESAEIVLPDFEINIYVNGIFDQTVNVPAYANETINITN